MAGLVYKDLLLLRRWLWYYGLMLGLFALFVTLGVLGPSVLPGLAMLFSYMLPLNTFSWDEAARWGAFAAASPACFRGIVDSKYALCLLCAGAGGLAAALLCALCRVLGAEADAALSACLLCAALTLLMDAVLLPVALRFGARAASWALLAVTLPLFGGGLALWAMSEYGSLALPVLSPVLSWLAAAACTLAFALSWLAARRRGA